MSQSINLRAVRWAAEQEGLSLAMKAVLMCFAIHADQRGYTWPSVDHIATKWGMDRKTVRRQIESLLVRRMIRRTNKKRGATGQVKVYRLPKITWERGGKCTPLKNERKVSKESLKSPISGGERDPNNGIMNKHQDHELMILGTSVPAASDNTGASSTFFSLSHQHQNQSARNHIKWPEFVAYCARQKGKRTKDGRIHDGIPTEDGFWKWLLGQKPYWRDKVRPPDHIDGYELHGKFYTADEANQRGREKPELIVKFRKAVKRDGKIQIKPTPTKGTNACLQDAPTPQ